MGCGSSVEQAEAPNNNNNKGNAGADAAAAQVAPIKLNLETLKRQDDVTSRAVLELLKGDAAFSALAVKEGTALVQRDKEDEEKLAKGIRYSIAKGVLQANPAVSATRTINVLGKSADAVADEIIKQLPAGESVVLVLTGLSGTGKGTTTAKLQKALPNTITWSNGNVFRTATHLINEALAKDGGAFAVERITPELIKAVFARLSFKRCDDGNFDVLIDGVTRVSTIANTTLKAPDVAQRVPTVAELTQGEVVLFATAAVQTLCAAGHTVVVEGRAQTLNYIETPYRFELAIVDPNSMELLGSRRAAQRVIAAALEKVGPTASEAEIAAACKEAAASLK